MCDVQLPAGARVSRDCRDLLLRLLGRDPESRISFEEFFLHPFVDLEHMPSAGSLGKAVSEGVSPALFVASPSDVIAALPMCETAAGLGAKG